jgi:hypothetical protein
MKSKAILFLAAIAVMSMLIGTTGCRKRKAFKNEDGQASVDARNAQGENDAAVGDINDVISNEPTLNGKSSGNAGTQGVTGNICGLDVDKSQASTGVVLLNYNGTTCNNRKREGSIRLTILDYALGKRWKDAGCVIKVEYLSYKITRASDGKSVEFNGTQQVTNVNGINWLDLIFNPAHPAVVITVTGTDLNAKFDGNKTAVYNIHRKFTYTFANSVLSCKGEGIGSHAGLNNLENYGTTRDGDAFTSQVTTPVIWNNTCGSRAPIQGEVVIKVDDKEFELTCLFGVDANGNSVNVSANTCPYGWKVSWKHKNKTNKKIIVYQ